jgi:hypothetical protein
VVPALTSCYHVLVMAASHDRSSTPPASSRLDEVLAAVLLLGQQADASAAAAAVSGPSSSAAGALPSQQPHVLASQHAAAAATGADHSPMRRRRVCNLKKEAASSSAAAAAASAAPGPGPAAAARTSLKRKTMAPCTAAEAPPAQPSKASLDFAAPEFKKWSSSGRCEEMTDSTPLWHARNTEALRGRLQQDGYLLIRGVIARPDVMRAREVIQKKLREVSGGRGWLVDMSAGVVEPADMADDVDQWDEVRRHSAVQSLPHHWQLEQLLRCVFGSTGHMSLGPDHQTTWIRAKARKEATPPHSDYGYFVRHRNIFKQFYVAQPLTYAQCQRQAALVQRAAGLSKQQQERACTTSCEQQQQQASRVCSLCGFGFHDVCLDLQPKANASAGSEDGEWHCPSCRDAYFSFFTCWMPLVDIPADPEYSRLIIAPGTHTLGGYSCSTGRDTSNSASNLLPSGWSDGGKQSICGQSTWHVPSQLSAGDIILFNIKTVHAANRHNRDDFRISIDTRIVGHESRKQHM